ncbi:ABC transporter ATP-binding protein [Peribacillus glennii]|uniref:ABC transporter ATP-binding protein n=1 Tax=Peribacillus glennii TaxID=2303991 RepID=A0A372LEU9_9BACI|nr:ABC transporter ATP-binding protein [Peribacillus glennii]RFU64820.1 ABC transporter ATP-binding protein [Peribacillus glennii]
MLKLDNINLFYGEIQALWNLSMEIKEGQIAALLGANAAGKSSTINAISGLEKISGGKITFLGKEIHKMDPHEIVEEGIIQVPEGRKLFNYMSIQENLELGAYSKRAKKDFKKNLRMVFDLFPILEERKNQFAGEMSGGQQQMCAIARGLMSSPKLLIIDELSLGLAPILVQKLLKALVDIKNSGITILLVEQNVKQSLAISDEACVLENGRLALSGKADELLNNPHLKKAYLGM